MNLPHPSFLELDRAALGVALPQTTQAHLAQCERCSAHLKRLADAPPLPPSVRVRAAQPRPPTGWLSRLGGAPPWGLLGAAVAALLVVMVSTPREVGPALSEKGLPSVQLFIKRGAQVWPWDGASLIVPGDLLQLQVAPSGFSYLQILGESGVLYRGALEPGAARRLPMSWRVDDSPGPERLTVVLSRLPIPDAQLAQVKPSKDIVRVEWSLSKQPRPTGKAP